MPTKRIGDVKGSYSEMRPCWGPDHNPPSHMVYEDGIYEHVCSACGNKTVFTVANPRY